MEVDQKIQRSGMILRSFWNVQKNTMRIIQKIVLENGITVPQYTILMQIAPQKELSQKTIGERTLLPKSTLSQSVEGLVQAGLLEREQVEGNRREVQLKITEEGEAFFNKIHFQERGIHQIFQKAIEPLTQQQYQDVLDAHQKIANYLEEYLSE